MKALTISVLLLSMLIGPNPTTARAAKIGGIDSASTGTTVIPTLASDGVQEFTACVNMPNSSAARFPSLKIASAAGLSGPSAGTFSGTIQSELQTVMFRTRTTACSGNAASDWASGQILNFSKLKNTRCELLKGGITLGAMKWTRKNCVVNLKDGSGVGYTSSVSLGFEVRDEVGIFAPTNSSGAIVTGKNIRSFVVKVVIKTAWACDGTGLAAGVQNLEVRYYLLGNENVSAPQMVGQNMFYKESDNCTNFIILIAK